MMPGANNATNLFFFSSRAKQFFTNPHSTAEEAIKDAKTYTDLIEFAQCLFTG